MAEPGLTGSRIRDRRIALGLRQGVLAQAVGISPSYLNLIEHNRRRIGGSLLLQISKVLDVDPSQLTEGAEAAVLQALGQAATIHSDSGAEVEKIQDLAGQFPGWVTLIARQQKQVDLLERTVAALNDRLTHDPQLAASMHEVISVVTAIRSTSAILASGEAVEPDWQNRFHRNMYEDSQRLAESAQALVQYLDDADKTETEVGLTLPQEELETWLAARGFVIPELEDAFGPNPAELLQRYPDLTAAKTTAGVAEAYFAQYQSDARSIPMSTALTLLDEAGPDPLRFAGHFSTGMATVLRRLSVILAQAGQSAGLVTCDSSGTMMFQKPVEGFALPRFGAACPLWPLFGALSRPMSPIRARVEQAGHAPQRFEVYAIAEPVPGTGFHQPPVFTSTMLILPEERASTPPADPIVPIGSSCRICPRQACKVRREPSILTDGF